MSTTDSCWLRHWLSTMAVRKISRITRLVDLSLWERLGTAQTQSMANLNSKTSQLSHAISKNCSVIKSLTSTSLPRDQRTTLRHTLQKWSVQVSPQIFQYKATLTLRKLQTWCLSLKSAIRHGAAFHASQRGKLKTGLSLSMLLSSQIVENLFSTGLAEHAWRIASSLNGILWVPE